MDTCHSIGACVPALPHRLSNFDEVLRLEQAVISSLRPTTQKNQPLIGLAFSGGGIRSATFNLGVLQALCKHRLLQKFDYLSTVSGGGYIGGWLSALIYRCGSTAQVETELAATTQAACVTNHSHQSSTEKALLWLRSFSNYLTPRSGLFSTDTLSAIAQWLTNTFLNQLQLLAIVLTTMMLVFYLSQSSTAESTLVISQLWQSGTFTNPFTVESPAQAIWGGLLIIFSVLASCYLCCLQQPSQTEGQRSLQAFAPQLMFFAGVAGLMSLFGSFIPITAMQWSDCVSESGASASQIKPNLLVGLGVPIGTLIISLVMIFIMGLLGRWMPAQTREWWHRIGGINLAFIAIWLILFSFALYLPSYVHAHYHNVYLNSGAGMLTWLTALLTSVLGKSQHTSSNDEKGLLNKLSAYLPHLVLFLILLVTGYLAYILSINGPTGNIFIALVLFIAISSWRFDINMLSLHNFYRNRLTRCYLGASNRNRHLSNQPGTNPFTGFNLQDDVKLKDLTNQRPYHLINTALNISDGSQLAWQQRQAAAFTFSPYFCGFDLGEKQVWYPTAAFIGKEGPPLGSLMAISGAAASPNMGYHTNPVMGLIMTIFNARLGRWIGNPLHENIGNRLLGKLGLPKLFKNPAQRKSPSFNLYYLMKELITSTGTHSGYLYLSDGGHFENLGVYELVRRQCTLIVVTDAEEDGQYVFEGLGNAIRKCKVDFGIRIDINMDALIPNQNSVDGKFKRSNSHFAIGTIQYPDKTGYLLYLKSSLTGNEPAELINYKSQQPAFPHESTADQFFDETQFESYRCLGEHIANHTIQEIQNGYRAPNTSKQSAMDAVKKILWPA